MTWYQRDASLGPTHRQGSGGKYHRAKFGDKAACKRNIILNMEAGEESPPRALRCRHCQARPRFGRKRSEKAVALANFRQIGGIIRMRYEATIGARGELIFERITESAGQRMLFNTVGLGIGLRLDCFPYGCERAGVALLVEFTTIAAEPLQPLNPETIAAEFTVTGVDVPPVRRC